jgi:hypothetical protein
MDDLHETHNHWKSSKKSLKWWKGEAGYSGCNIRRLCNIPLSHPSKTILIDYIYLLQLEYVISVTNCKSARKKALCFQQTVTQILISKLKQRGVSITDPDFFTAATS